MANLWPLSADAAEEFYWLNEKFPACWLASENTQNGRFYFELNILAKQEMRRPW